MRARRDGRAGCRAGSQGRARPVGWRSPSAGAARSSAAGRRRRWRAGARSRRRRCARRRAGRACCPSRRPGPGTPSRSARRCAASRSMSLARPGLDLSVAAAARRRIRVAWQAGVAGVGGAELVARALDRAHREMDRPHAALLEQAQHVVVALGHRMGDGLAEVARQDACGSRRSPEIASMPRCSAAPTISARSGLRSSSARPRLSSAPM